MKDIVLSGHTEEDKASSVESKAKCPKCGSLDLTVLEVREEIAFYDQKNGKIKQWAYFEPGDILRVECICIKCKYRWKPRGVVTIYGLYRDYIK